MSSYIRFANESDSEILGEIHSQSLAFAYKGIFPDDYIESRFSFERRKEGFKRELASGHPETAIIYKDDIPTGLFTIGKSRYGNVDDSCVEIWRIYLKPSHIGKGIGTELMNWGIDELHKRGCKKAILWVLDDNHRARAFYERVGFNFDGNIQTIDNEIRELRYSRDI